MDVRFYPPEPSATDPARNSHYSQYCTKFDGESMFLGLPEPNADFAPGNQFRVPASPSQTQQSPKLTGHWKRDTDAPRMPWSYPVPGLGDEDFNIPPITPPTLPEHVLAHVPAHVSETDSAYHSLCSVSQGGLNFPMPLEMSMGQDSSLLNNSLAVMQQMVNSDSRYSSPLQIEALRPRSQLGMGPPSQLTTINQSQLSSQLGVSGNGVHGSPSPPESKSATPSPSSSVHEDEAEDSLKSGAEKRAASDMAKKPKTPKKKKKKDPNEPQKPVSAYALFFRDTQAAIKGQNPNATFGEVSKIVASMWDGLGEEQKQGYKKKTETAKKEYLKQLAAYRASLVSQSYSETDMKVSQTSGMFTPKPTVFSGAGHSHPGLYCPSYPQQPVLPPGLARGCPPRSSSITATTPPLQISPPLHPHPHLNLNLNLHHQQQHQQQQQQPQQIRHTLPLHSASMSQGFPPLQVEYQSLINVSSAGPSLDYRSSCRTGPGQSLDWSPDYCGNSALQRDKALYLT
ncbi:thymocyte selection-associated high mobility group box protein TOX [Hoplias malabaricus]|uniref:thymocyte selection-associated high mobility group box protein TOX n=1 Tax=Hoplias malabaricus TaxID=27720 RepID=UPI003462F180